MGIKYYCKCGKIIQFPDTPNTDTDKWEMLAHKIYTACANDKKPCWECSIIKKDRAIISEDIY